ncbi:hypothetical protein NEPAR08_1354 [Nematocida parisii]|nr:hypothetical protein NEPAR08_1354 [Nematocida parisii]
MWIEVYFQDKFAIEKKIEEAPPGNYFQKPGRESEYKDINSRKLHKAEDIQKKCVDDSEEDSECVDMGYRTVREYIVDKEVGRYRLIDKNLSGPERVLCGSWSFNRIIRWIEVGVPAFFETLSFGLSIGSYIKAYESTETIILVGSTGICVFSVGHRAIVEYSVIREIKVHKNMEIIYMDNEWVDSNLCTSKGSSQEEYDVSAGAPCSAESATKETNCTKPESIEKHKPRTASDEQQLDFHVDKSGESSGGNYKKITCSVFNDLEEEIRSLALSSAEEISSVSELVYMRICERLCVTIPLYNQHILHIASHSTGTITITNDFIIIKENSRYLAFPLCMIRKVEIIKGWSVLLRIRDANYREFKLYLERNDDLSIEGILLNIAREDPKFKTTYFEVLLDLLKNSKCMNYNLNNGHGDWSMGRSSEYRIYLCMKTAEGVSLQVNKNDRPFIWLGCFCICGMVSAPDLYHASVEKSKKTYFTSYEQIEKDIRRSIYESVPDTVYAGLKKVMQAFTAYNNNEYLQAHSMIGGVLYRILGESGCFYALVHIFTRILPDYIGAEIYGMHRDLFVFIEFTKEKYPGLHHNLIEKEIELEILVTPWILSLFSTIFQKKHIEVIFDYIAYYGPSFVFKLSLALLERMYLGISRSKKTGSILKISAQYFFNNTSTPSLSDSEFSLLINLAQTDSVVTPERVHYKRQQYELAHRKV